MHFVFSGTGYINKAEWKNDYPYTASQRGRRTHRSLREVWGWSRGCKERETSAKELNLFCYTIMKRIKYLINFFLHFSTGFFFSSLSIRIVVWMIYNAERGYLSGKKNCQKKQNSHFKLKLISTFGFQIVKRWTLVTIQLPNG